MRYSFLYVVIGFIMTQALTPNLAIADEDCRQFTNQLRRECYDAASDNDDREACRSTYVNNLNRCSQGDIEAVQMDQQRQRANSGSTYDTGPFIVIPQRQPYILPGQR